METMLIVMLIVLWILIWISSPIRPWIRKRWRRLKAKYTPDVFDSYYIEGKAFYMYTFGRVPSTTYVSDIDVGKAFDYVNTYYKEWIMNIYQACFFNRAEGRQEFSKTFFVLDNRMMVELSGDMAKIFYPPAFYGQAAAMLDIFSGYRLPQKQKDFEINIITFSNGELDLKALAIKPTELDLDLYYNDGFKETDQVIRTRLNQSNDKGIVLLHGLPGTGKTTYLRHLVGGMSKRVLFVSPSVAGNLMNPEFIDLLLDNPNSILIIEDAENIMMDRKRDSGSTVSNLLNLSDGLLSDCLNVQIICTFNSSLDLIDSALMRKGRLIARYEFGKLTVAKAQKLSNHLGFHTVIDKPMTIADIANQDVKEYGPVKTAVIGFRKQEEVVMN